MQLFQDRCLELRDNRYDKGVTLVEQAIIQLSQLHVLPAESKDQCHCLVRFGSTSPDLAAVQLDFQLVQWCLQGQPLRLQMFWL